MKIYTSISKINNKLPICVALGNFDGVHLGHRKLIEMTIKTAKENNLRSAIFTFSENPKTVFSGGGVKRIMHDAEKIKMLEDMGIDILFNVPFDENTMTMSPMNFLSDILIDKINMKHLFCGFNFRFGYRGEGDVNFLLKHSKEFGYALNVMSEFRIDDNVVSSSLIRKKITNGDMQSCAELLGRKYRMSGVVVEGNRIGKDIGFPTSNLPIDESLVAPENGVFATYCIYENQKYPSITNIGTKPTIPGEHKKNLETHIFDFDKELYGKAITVEFVHKIREERKFSSLINLSEQIAIDCTEVKKYLSSLE